MIRREESYVNACLNDMHMLNVSGGKDRTYQEFQNFLERSGFKIAKLYPVEAALMIIEAEPAS